MISLNDIEKSRSFIVQVIKGATLLSAGTIVYTLSMFVFRYFLLHTWTPHEYGIFTLILTIVGLLGIFTEFNLNSTTTIFLAKDLKNPENKKVLMSILTSFLFLVSVCFIVSYALVYLTSFNFTILETFRQYFILIWLLVITTGMTAISYGFVRAYKRMDFEAYSKVLSGVLIICLLALLTHASSKFSLESSVIILITAQILALLIIVLLLLKRKVISINPNMSAKILIQYLGRTKLSDLSSVLIFSFYMSGIGMIAIILLSIDKFMIPVFLSTEMLGFYSGAYFIAGIPKIITSNIATVIQALAAEKSDNVEYAKSTYLAFLSIFIFLALVGYCLFIYFAKFSLILLPTEYTWVVSTIQILLVGMFFSNIFWFNATFISSLRKTKIIKQITITLGIITIVNIILNYIFIPEFGIAGAAIATTISFIVICVISTIQVIKIKE